MSAFGEPWQPLAETEQVQFFIDWDEPAAAPQQDESSKTSADAEPTQAEEPAPAEEVETSPEPVTDSAAETAETGADDWDWDASVVDDAIEDDFWGGDFDPMEEEEQNASTVVAPGDLFSVDTLSPREKALWMTLSWTIILLTRTLLLLKR